MSQLGHMLLLHRALYCEATHRNFEALKLYHQVIAAMTTLSEHMDPSHLQRDRVLLAIESHRERAAKIEDMINILKERSELIECIKIEENDTDFGFHNVYGKYLCKIVQELWIEEPNLYTTDHFANFVAFLECVVKQCDIRYIRLITRLHMLEPMLQLNAFKTLQERLKLHCIDLDYKFSSCVDCSIIILSSGIVFKSMNALHYHKSLESLFELGLTDRNYRQCHASVIQVYFALPCPAAEAAL